LRAASIVCGLLAACTPAAEPRASEPVTEPAVVVERDTPAQRLELGEALGGSALVQPPSPGRYAVAVSFSQHRFVTMEHTINQAIEGIAVIELAVNGDARACFAAHDSSVSDISHYQSHDGEDHHHVNEGDDMLGARGSWSAVPGTQEIELRLDRLGYRSCDVDETTTASETPLLLRCNAIASTSKIPSAGLLCRSASVQRVVAKLSLFLGEHARSWELRNDLAHREPPTGDDAVPWLLLGVGDGLRVRGTDNRSGVTLEVELAKVERPKPPLEN
jgi:hypothetical protein